MKTVPGQLRAKTVKGAPCLAMSATATEAEIEELKSNLGLRPGNTIVLRSDPVQTQHNYIRVVRPANIYGTFGSESIGGSIKPVPMQLMNKSFLINMWRKWRKEKVLRNPSGSVGMKTTFVTCMTDCVRGSKTWLLILLAVHLL